MINKHSCLDRAEALLLKNDEISLRYACLELRFCIEFICYEKLKIDYADLPKNIENEWNPKIIIEILSELNPFSSTDYSINLIMEDSPINLCTVKAMPISFIKEHYYKLGKYVHAPNLKDQKNNKINLKELSTYLSSLVEKLKEHRYTGNSSLFYKIIFTCQNCQSPIVRNETYIEDNQTLRCFNPACKTEYIVKKDENGIFINMQSLPFNCLNCQSAGLIAKHDIETKLLKIGNHANYYCPECKQKHVFVNTIQVFLPTTDHSDTTQPQTKSSTKNDH